MGKKKKKEGERNSKGRKQIERDWREKGHTYSQRSWSSSSWRWSPPLTLEIHRSKSITSSSSAAAAAAPPLLGKIWCVVGLRRLRREEGRGRDERRGSLRRSLGTWCRYPGYKSSCTVLYYIGPQYGTAVLCDFFFSPFKKEKTIEIETQYEHRRFFKKKKRVQNPDVKYYFSYHRL